MLLHISATVTVVLTLLVSKGAGNSTYNNTECIFTDIDSSLRIASQIIETARQQLPNDLEELCRKTFNYTDDAKEVHYVKPVDCSDIYLTGARRNGLYDIWPQSRLSNGPLRVYCDMESDGGGWTVVQRRGDYKSPEDYFYQDWNTYKRGFGDILKDFWIGNDNLFALTNQRSYQLKVDLSDWEENSGYAIYDEFWTADDVHDYRLHVKGYRGTAGDSLTDHQGAAFFTRDSDHRSKCAADRKSAWWYKECYNSCDLNAPYKRGPTGLWDKVVYWKTFRGDDYSLKVSVMKIRPAGFDVKPPE